MPSEAPQELLRSLPKIDDILHLPTIEALLESMPRPFVVEAVRNAVDARRMGILEGTCSNADTASVAEDARCRALALKHRSLRRVINASGVVVHTNLGRSVLATEAMRAVEDVMHGYSTLEYDTNTLARGSRHDHCERLICALTGAEAAIAVNNNAAAVMMVLNEFALGRKAVVSRGELVEIGGSFRIPDIMAFSHAEMVEVGATNKTHAVDYARAIDDDTAMLLKVHPSNYRMIGFAESVDVSELRKLADEENARREKQAGLVHSANAGDNLPPRPGQEAQDNSLLVYEDQGSGSIVRLDCFGSYAEPTVAESIEQGCDLVSFSGDKLLGGPQAGIIVGSKRCIDRLKKNPLARAMRLDKMTLAALESTLRLYLDGERALRDVPTLRMLSESPEDVRTRAEALETAMRAAIPCDAAHICIAEEISRAGGGALPMCDIPTYVVRVEFQKGCALDCERHLVSERDVPVVARIKKDALLFDARTILDTEEIEEIARAVTSYFEGISA